MKVNIPPLTFKPKFSIDQEVYIAPWSNLKLYEDYNKPKTVKITGYIYKEHAIHKGQYELRYLTHYSDQSYSFDSLYYDLIDWEQRTAPLREQAQAKLKEQHNKRATDYYKKAKLFVAEYETAKNTNDTLPTVKSF